MCSPGWSEQDYLLRMKAPRLPDKMRRNQAIGELSCEYAESISVRIWNNER